MTRSMLVSVATLTLAGCMAAAASTAQAPQRLVIPPPTTSPHSAAPTGLQPLGLGEPRDGKLYVPSSYDPTKPTPLILLLHGATQSSAMWFGAFTSFGPLADSLHAILLAPDSWSRTWDFVVDSTDSRDLARINGAIASTSARYNIDRRRVAIVGFSDGASFALTLGLANGDLAPSVVAFSPGFALSTTHRGTPSFFVSHGTVDQILPIDQTSRQLVPELRSDGYTVDYHEFTGRHQIPPAIADTATAWLAKRWAAVGATP